MTTLDIPNAHVFPEDSGTDADDDYEQQWSAGFFGGHARHEEFSDYVATGLQFYPDHGVTSLDITSGMAHILVDAEVEVQAQSGNYSETWRSGITISVDVPGVEGLSVSSGSVNHVYLAVDMGAGDGAYYEINQTGESPEAPHVKIGEYDHGNDSVNYLNRGPHIITEEDLDDLAEDIDALGSTVSSLGSDVSSLDSEVSGLDSEVSSLGSDVSTLDSEVSGLDSTVSDNTTRLESLEQEVGEWEQFDPSNLEDRLDGLEEDINIIEAELETRAHIVVLEEGEQLPVWADGSIRWENNE